MHPELPRPRRIMVAVCVHARTPPDETNTRHELQVRHSNRSCCLSQFVVLKAARHQDAPQFQTQRFTLMGWWLALPTLPLVFRIFVFSSPPDRLGLSLVALTFAAPIPPLPLPDFMLAGVFGLG